MPDNVFLFVDFDDTLSDQSTLMAQYVIELGQLLSEEYEGPAEDWSAAAQKMLAELAEEYRLRFDKRPLAGYCEWLESTRARSIESVCRQMGKPVPANAAETAKEMQFNALTACNSAYPGASEALMTLFEEGYRTQIASGHESQYLLAALIGAGVESYTESKFGADLVDCAKEGPQFYTRIFEMAGVSPEKTLVVDDHPDALCWALEAGARVAQVKLSATHRYDTVDGVAAVITGLDELPDVVRRLLI